VSASATPDADRFDLDETFATRTLAEWRAALRDVAGVWAPACDEMLDERGELRGIALPHDTVLHARRELLGEQGGERLARLRFVIDTMLLGPRLGYFDPIRDGHEPRASAARRSATRRTEARAGVIDCPQIC
jgi:hypothetical protein